MFFYFRDVYTGLIGFADKMRWPQHYTLNGNLNVDGEAKNMKFVDKEKLVGFEVCFFCNL